MYQSQVKRIAAAQRFKGLPASGGAKGDQGSGFRGYFFRFAYTLPYALCAMLIHLENKKDNDDYCWN